MQRRVLIAGASGSVGSELLELAVGSGLWIRALSRRPIVNCKAQEQLSGDALEPTAIRGVCDGVDVVASCVGASVALDSPEKRSYLEVDVVSNRNLIEEAKRAGIRRFLYIAAFVNPGYQHTAYVRAHEQVVELLRSSGLSYTIVRPTGIFSALHDILKMAHWGFGIVIGSGEAKTNPVHQRDVARICLANLFEGPAEMAVGGPEVVSRRGIAEAAFRALDKKGRVISVPPEMMRFSARMMGPLNRRKAELFDFASAVSVSESIAPQLGSARLEDYFRNLLKKSQPWTIKN